MSLYGSVSDDHAEDDRDAADRTGPHGGASEGRPRRQRGSGKAGRKEAYSGSFGERWYGWLDRGGKGWRGSSSARRLGLSLAQVTRLIAQHRKSGTHRGSGAGPKWVAVRAGVHGGGHPPAGAGGRDLRPAPRAGGVRGAAAGVRGVGERRRPMPTAGPAMCAWTRCIRGTATAPWASTTSTSSTRSPSSRIGAGRRGEPSSTVDIWSRGNVERLVGLSVSHLYNLRRWVASVASLRWRIIDQTRARAIGERRLGLCVDTGAFGLDGRKSTWPTSCMRSRNRSASVRWMGLASSWMQVVHVTQHEAGANRPRASAPPSGLKPTPAAPN